MEWPGRIFTLILQMSLTGSLAILIVCLTRLLLNKAPKWISSLLWIIVLVRLICPVTVTSGFSLIPQSVSNGQILSDWAETYTGDVQIIHSNNPEYQMAVDAGREPIYAGEGEYYTVTQTDGTGEPETVQNTVFPVLGLVWMAGTAGMMLYGLLSGILLKRKLIGAVRLRENIWISDYIETPFVWGLVFPKIYLPSSLDEKEQAYIILHERYHIRRLDHITRLIAYFVLCLHWFNPLVWLAFVLSGRDMEMSCDEAVVRKMGDGIRADYAASLLRLTTHRFLAGAPLAFGEGDTSSRIRNLSGWKKPAKWVIAAAVILTALVGISLLTNPRPGQDTLKFLGVQDDSWSWNAEFAADFGEQVGSGTIYAEQWSDGECVRSSPVTFTRFIEELSIQTGFDRENGSVNIQIDTDQYGGSLLTGFQLPDDRKAIGWSFTSYEDGEKIAVNPGEERILAALAFDLGEGVRAFDCETLTRDPERLEQADYMIVIRICFDDTPVEPQEEAEVSGEPKTVLQLSDVVALAEKGESLSWADFEQYDFIETGSGLYIRLYPIDEMFTLAIGGAGPEEQPMYINLSANDGTDEYIDIRTDDPEEYIRQHQDNPIVTNCVYDTQISPVGFSGDGFIRMFDIDSENTGSLAISAIRFLPVVKIESVDELDEFILEMEDELSFDQTAPGLRSFSETVQQYDAAFFETKTLLLVYSIDGTEEFMPGVAYVRRKEDILSVGISYLQSEDDTGNDGQDGWLISIAVPTEQLQGITGFDARSFPVQ